MKNYDYYEAVKNDVIDYIKENYTDEEIQAGLDEEELYNSCWISDSVTGNGSGSYTFCTATAWDNLGSNLDLMEEAAACFGDEPIIKDEWDHGPEWWDVSIRCYLLSGAISEALEELS